MCPKALDSANSGKIIFLSGCESLQGWETCLKIIIWYINHFLKLLRKCKLIAKIQIVQDACKNLDKFDSS